MSIFRFRRDPVPHPVEVAFASNQAEADMIQGILKDEGIPSLTRKPNGSFLTDLFAMGPRHIVVPASAGEKAKAILADYENVPESSLPGL
jgi:hypothetical protein